MDARRCGGEFYQAQERPFSSMWPRYTHAARRPRSYQGHSPMRARPKHLKIYGMIRAWTRPLGEFGAQADLGSGTTRS